MATQGQRRRTRAERNKRLWEEQQVAAKPASQSVIDAIDREIVRSTPWVTRTRKSPIELLHDRGSLNDRQFDGLNRLRKAYERSGHEPKVTANLEPSYGGSAEMSQKALEQHQKYEAAIKSLPVGHMRSVVFWVVCAEAFYVSEWEEKRQVRSHGKGNDLLREAGNLLADHFHMHRDVIGLDHSERSGIEHIS